MEVDIVLLLIEE